MTPSLLEPARLGPFALRNRIAMSAMTRHRSPRRVPVALNASYYGQRASAGLIVTESVAVSRQGASWIESPGLYTAEQVAGWKRVADEVHARGGLLFAQLFHCGRCSCSGIHAEDDPPVAPSAQRAQGVIRPAPGRTPVEYMQPRELAAAELPRIVQDFARAAANAKAAGFDGVELHAANGFLLDQFLRDGANHRSDAYGGSVAHRSRLLLEVFAAVAEVLGPERVGVHVSPTNGTNGMRDSDPQALFEHVARELTAARALYLHVVEGALGGLPEAGRIDLRALRRSFGGAYIANNGYDLARASAALAAGDADLVSFGRAFIANPDLPRRLRLGLPLAAIRPDVAERSDAVGYTDYPEAAAG